MDPAFLPFPPAICDPDAQGDGTACGLLQAQRQRVRADWRIASAIRPETMFERYLYFWFIVNTRSFYYEKPGVKKHPPRLDRIAMCPYLDLFNHSVSGCDVTLTPSGFVLTSDKTYGAVE
ncbi:MAG: hypothetical protein Q9222_000172 [Ikaeria aurantiellina]